MKIGLATFFVFLSCSLLAQQPPSDSIIVRNFGSGDYKASSINYSGAIDENGIIYFANENGILKYDGSEWEIIPIINFAATYSIYIASDGRFYVGGQNEYGYLEKDSINQFTYHSLRSTIGNDVEFGPFWQIEEINKQIYFCSYQGIVRYDGEGGSLIDIKNSSILNMDEELYITKLDGSLYKVENDSTYLVNDTQKWENDNIYAALPSNQDSSYVIFTSENGLFRYNTKTNKLSPINGGDNEILKKKGIYDAQVWRDSLFAISSWSDGFKIIDEKGNILTNITKASGIQTDKLHDFIIDKRGNVWAGSPFGVIYLQWHNNPQAQNFEPKTIITKTLTKYDQNEVIRSIEFHFATPGYDKLDLLYSYYLEGYDEDFSNWKSDIKKEYTNLDGGNYVFHVKAKLLDGRETEQANYQFFIPTPWYKKPLFIALMLVFIISVVIVTYRYRTMRLKQLNKRLENIINNRTKELILQREQLKEANEELIIANTELDNFVYRSSHDLVAPLKSLKGLINLAKIEAPDDRQSEYLTMMSNSVGKLEEFIKSIMEYSINSKREVTQEPVKLNDLIDSICQDLQYYDNADKVKFIKNYEPDLVIMSDEKRLKIVLSNLITNCIKYHNYDQDMPLIEINVNQHTAHDLTDIEVRDNGMGIEQEHLDKIFDMFFRASSDKAEGSGLGLYIVKDTVEKLGGKITVASDLGVGTCFTLTLNESLTAKNAKKLAVEK